MANDPGQRIEQFAGEIQAALGDNLLSVMAFGSAARGTWMRGRSDINLLLLVRDAGAGALRPAAGSIAQWTKRGEPAPLIFSLDEWKTSADVFPLEIEDMREAHRVVRGMDPLDGVTTSRDHQRHQLEREVREKLLRLRTQYAAASTSGESLARLLETSVGSFVALLRGTIRLAGRKVPMEPDAVVREASQVAGLESEAFEWALARRARRSANGLQPFDPLAARYVDQVQKLAQYVNRL